MMNKRKVLISILIFILAALIIWTAWGNTALEISEYTVCSEKLPDSFSGFRIAQISDLHNAEFGDENEKLIHTLRQSEPDIIVMTGDLVDSRRTEIEIALQFAEEAVKIAPCYYVPGNHEARLLEYDTLKKGLKLAGVTVLENECDVLERSGDSVALLGVSDPSFHAGELAGDDAAVMEETLKELLKNLMKDVMKEPTGSGEVYTVLLSHRPELFDIYVGSGINLVFSGHAHGGQFRLPAVGGLIAPNQGLFPQYDAGLFTEGETSMIVSRGIGNSIIPFRFNNRPEVVVAELRKQ